MGKETRRRTLSDQAPSGASQAEATAEGTHIQKNHRSRLPRNGGEREVGERSGKGRVRGEEREGKRQGGVRREKERIQEEVRKGKRREEEGRKGN